MHDANGRDTIRIPVATTPFATPRLKGHSRSASMRSLRFVLTFAAVLAVAVATLFVVVTDDAQVQSQQPPPFSAVIYDGRVTVNNDPNGLQGLALSAKVGDWVSESVTIGDGTHDSNGYKNLTVNPPSELIGNEVTFLLNGSVESITTDFYAIINADGSVCTSCPIDFPQFRFEFGIDFPSRPTGGPVATQPPAATPDQPVPGQQTITQFTGQALTPQGPVPDGYQVFAVVGENIRSNSVTVFDGIYNLAVETTGSEHDGSPIKFFLIDKGDPNNPNKTLEAETPSEFNPGQQTEVRLFFPMLAATATPEPPTATPEPPTPTPEPPTPTPVPPTSTPIPPTPTPVPPTPTPVPPSPTPIPPTPTTVPPTATPVPPTATPVPPTATPVPPTATPVPPTATPVPPTATPVPPTATLVPPTATPMPPTATPVSPTATPVPPVATQVPEETGGGFNATLPLAIVLVLLLIGIAAYFGWRYTQQSREGQ